MKFKKSPGMNTYYTVEVITPDGKVGDMYAGRVRHAGHGRWVVTPHSLASQTVTNRKDAIRLLEAETHKLLEPRGMILKEG